MLLFFVFRTPLSFNNSTFLCFPATCPALLSRSSLSIHSFFAQSCCSICVLSSHVISLGGSCRAFRKRKRHRVSVVYSAYKFHVLCRSLHAPKWRRALTRWPHHDLCTTSIAKYIIAFCDTVSFNEVVKMGTTRSRYLGQR